MTEIGTVIAGKYEILKEVGHGGMSVVYLATDTHLNKNWAVKEIKKKGNGKNDEIIVNSLLAEANLMKRLDHVSLPRIVDIIDNGVTIYVVMDYIEGESLDKVMAEYGAQPEELVIAWAKQICDALSYLHSQKPPIIYRDMKPANVMLKDDGNIKIIDFGIAREYKEQNLADTTVLGTKGYAPPEQYSGQTDARSDIFALGMTMHHLLTGVDPRNGEAYAPVRQWIPELSEGIEAIINKCVEPAPENRYQNCADLLYDLEHPDLVTKGYKKKQKRKLGTFIASAGLSVVMALVGLGLSVTVDNMNKNNYDILIATPDFELYEEAAKILPKEIDAYQKMIAHSRKEESEDFIKRTNQAIASGFNDSDYSKAEVVELYYDLGELYFVYGDEPLDVRCYNAKASFEKAASDDNADFDKKGLAKCYLTICEFMETLTPKKSPSLKEYKNLFEKINSSLDILDNNEYEEVVEYDRLAFYYSTILLIKDQANGLVRANYNKEEILGLVEEIYQKTNSFSLLPDEAEELQKDINSEYEKCKSRVNELYDIAENGG